MKQFVAILMAAICTLTLAACGTKQPSLDEVEQAIQEGNLTIEDALEKEWITQEWADDYRENTTIPAGNKMDAGIVGEFMTTTLTGEEFTKEQLGDVALFVFLNPADPNAEAFYNALTEGYDGVRKNDAEIVVCIENDSNNELFSDAPFPVIRYNDSLKNATKNHKDMIEDIENSASWYVNGSFLSAWYSSVQADDLVDSAASFVAMQKEMKDGIDSENSGMAVMG